MFDIYVTKISSYFKFGMYVQLFFFVIYVTNNIKKLINLKRKTRNKYLKTRKDTDHKYYKAIRNYLSVAIKNEKPAYIQYRLEGGRHNPKRIWKNGNIHKMEHRVISEELHDPNISYFLKAIRDTSVNQDAFDYYKNNVHPNVQSTLSNLKTLMMLFIA